MWGFVLTVLTSATSSASISGGVPEFVLAPNLVAWSGENCAGASQAEAALLANAEQDFARAMSLRRSELHVRDGHAARTFGIVLAKLSGGIPPNEHLNTGLAVRLAASDYSCTRERAASMLVVLLLRKAELLLDEAAGVDMDKWSGGGVKASLFGAASSYVRSACGIAMAHGLGTRLGISGWCALLDQASSPLK